MCLPIVINKTDMMMYLLKKSTKTMATKVTSIDCMKKWAKLYKEIAIYNNLSVNERINLRAAFYGSLWQKQRTSNYLISFYAIIQAVKFATAWQWYWEN